MGLRPLGQDGAEESKAGGQCISSLESVRSVPGGPWALRPPTWGAELQQHLPPSPPCRLLRSTQRSAPAPPSGEQAPAAQAAGAALVRRAQLACFVLPDLAYQGVESILHALGRGPSSGRDHRLSWEQNPSPFPTPQTGSRALPALGPRAASLGGLSSAAPQQPTESSGPLGTHGALWGHRGWGPRVTAPVWLRAALSRDLHLPWELFQPRPGPWPPSLPCHPGRLTARGAAGSRGSRRVPEGPGAGARARAAALRRWRGGSEPCPGRTGGAGPWLAAGEGPGSPGGS